MKSTSMKRTIYFLITSAVISLASCADPAKNEAQNSATEGNNTDTSSSSEQFTRDTTINMNSGGGTGTNQSKADTMANEARPH